MMQMKKPDGEKAQTDEVNANILQQHFNTRIFNADPPPVDKYLELDLDEKVPVRDGYITFTRHLKYLGSWISDTLQDDYELDIRLKRAKGQMGSLKPFFRCPGIELATKYKVYMAIPVNTALWGCESWSMTENMRRRIRAFHHQSIRSILRINMHMVETCRIKNPTIRQWFCNTPCILDIAKKRQLDWIGKVARMEETKIQ